MKRCIVTGGSCNDVAPMASLLLNLKKTQTWIDQVIIYHDGISQKDQKLMCSIVPVEFREYTFPGNMNHFNEIVRYVYTPMIFCKYECIKLLESFDYVVWTDYDVLFLSDVPELLKFNDNSSGIKMMKAIYGDSCCFFRDQIRQEGYKYLSKYCPLDSISVFTNLMVFSRKLNDYLELYQQCIHFTEEFGEWLVLPEQAVFDMVLNQLHIEVESISWDYAYRPEQGKPIFSNAKILHSISQPKFWNGLENEQWNNNYAQWLAMGGSPWKPLSPWCVRSIRKKISFMLDHIFHNR